MQRAGLTLGFPVVRAHSKGFLKRLRGHPRTWPPAPEPVVPAPRYPAAPVQAAPSGWLPPSGAGAAASLPFQVERTTIGRSLPVYTDFKNGRTRSLTVVRHVRGNAGALVEELRRVTGGAEVTARPGRIEVEGNKAAEIKTWLAGLGF